jgi:hypothetical protein
MESGPSKKHRVFPWKTRVFSAAREFALRARAWLRDASDVTRLGCEAIFIAKKILKISFTFF